ncbi:unnamed protein product, partial [marine sediment metagenome]
VDVIVEDRDKLEKGLLEAGIKTRKYYPALHTQEPYKHVKGKFPNSDYISQHGLWLPSYINLEDGTIDYICRKIQKVLE